MSSRLGTAALGGRFHCWWSDFKCLWSSYHDTPLPRPPPCAWPDPLAWNWLIIHTWRLPHGHCYLCTWAPASCSLICVGFGPWRVCSCPQLYWFIDLTEKWDLLMGLSKEWTAPKLSWVQGCHLSRGSQLSMCLTPQSCQVSWFSATFSNSPPLNLVNPHFLETWIFWWSGNLNLALRRASVTCTLFCSSVKMDMMTRSMWTLATVPWGFQRPHAYLAGA